MTLQLTGPPGDKILIETSADLQTWAPLTVITGATGPVVFEDANADNPPQRFYRTQTAP